MRLWVGGLTLLLAVCSQSKVVPNDAGSLAELAMVCGKVTQHKDLSTGQWVSDSAGQQDCITDKNEILAYCKKVYPTLAITDILTTEKVHVPAWCAIGSTAPCKGHAHNVHPIKCVVGQYKTSALEVPAGCEFEHTHNAASCESSEHWLIEAGNMCSAKGKTVKTTQMLKPCDSLDSWQGVQVLCCDKPTLVKPKPNKGKHKTTTADDIVVVDKKDAENPCMLPKLVGMCRAIIPMWHFNSETKTCEIFYYGGCGGNKNNFKTQKDCQRKCMPSAKEVEFCGLPSETGFCRAYFPRWYYDADAGQCQQFVFGGCGGNKNNFLVKDDCESACTGYTRTNGGNPAVTPPLLNPVIPMGPGPVILNNLPPMEISVKKKKNTTTLAPETPVVPLTYSQITDVDSEHGVFINKLDALKSEHQGKVNKILGKWDSDNAKLRADKEQKELENLEMDLQMTISSLEDEYDNKMSKLSEFHMSRMDRMLAEKRTKALQRFLNQLQADTPKVRHVLTTLEKYIDIEVKDKTHVLQHLYMAKNDDFNGENVQDLKSRIEDIEERVNNTTDRLNDYPDILALIQEDVEQLLAKMPQTPVDEDDDDTLDQEIIDDLDDSLDRDPGTRIRIDDGGLSKSKACLAGAPEVGPCKASFTRFHYDAMDNNCKPFTYGGCEGNANNFETLDECRDTCINSAIRFDDIDANGVLNPKEINPYTIDEDNSIDSALDVYEDGPEDESELDDEVDAKYDHDGNPKTDYTAEHNDPAAMFSNQEEWGPVVDYANSSSWAMWLGVGLAVAVLVAVVIVVASKSHFVQRSPSRVVVDDKGEEPTKDLTPEEKQLLQLQQNGYENPTYKFFEKQTA